MASARNILAPSKAFSGTIKPTRIPLHYQLGLAVVALAMVLLPVIYVALVVAMGELVWWHLTNDWSILEHLRGSSIVLGLLAYLGPAIAGVIFVLFLIKPLFSRGEKEGKPFKVLEANEPELFAFVRKICELVGAPAPREVRLDCKVNASAGFRRGWLSFFGNDLVLTLGLPLVAGMTARQVAGVLAHEFGHFAQGAGMRLTYIIRSVNAWFARVVYERDSWDERLEQWANIDDWRIKIIFKLAQGGVWVGRKVLWGLMQAGHAISCFMSRQMEFDADSYEAKVAGSEEFARTAERLRLLNAANAAAISDARSIWQRRELPDDLPALVVWRESVMPEDVRKQFTAQVEDEKTHWAQTHPCDRDRIRAALALSAPGVFHQDDPASSLFSDFVSVSRAVTRHYYEHDQNLPLETATFRTAADMVADRQASDVAGKQLAEFFGEAFTILRLKPVPVTTAQAWQPSLVMMRNSAGEYAAQMEEHGTVSEKIFKQSVGLDLVQAKFSLSSPSNFALSSSNSRDVQASLVYSKEKRQSIEASMERHENAAIHRLAAALVWLDAQPTESDERKQRRALLIQVQRGLARSLSDFATIRQARTSLNMIMQNASTHPDGIALEKAAKDIAIRAQLALNHVLQSLGDVQHPYLPSGTPIRLSLHNADPDDNAYVRAFKAADISDEALMPLLVRVQGELCGMALAAEKEMTDSPPPPPEPITPGTTSDGLPMPSL